MEYERLLTLFGMIQENLAPSSGYTNYRAQKAFDQTY